MATRKENKKPTATNPNNKEKGMRVATRVRAGDERERKWEQNGKRKYKNKAGKEKKGKERKRREKQQHRE